MTKHTQGTSVPTLNTFSERNQINREETDALVKAAMIRSMGPAVDNPVSGDRNSEAAPQVAIERSSRIAPGTSIPSISPLTTLANLDRYLAAADHAVDHPWRKEIAASLASAVPNSDITGNCIDNIDSAIETLNGLLSMALKECTEAGRDEKIGAAIRAARRYVEDISDYNNCLGWSAA